MEYTIKRSRRAKYMRLRVHPGGVVILTVPYASEATAIQQFVSRQAEWLKWAVRKMMQYKALPVSGRRDYLKFKEDARSFLHERVAYWNAHYNFSFRRIAIKNTSRTWGSCSKKGNLNFSFSLLFLPKELADYVVVHELSHLAHPNHSRSFWAEIAKTIPDFQARRQELKRYMPRS
ncbi:MAG: hypothetical protein G01um10148_992 [Parcubacteria group bacterium Gr01-1014_8]|nr:MAG: hypothetical protein G01um10148_992 [Parcubacteria group bacterium Gr01-1014_8]